jgi:hypothetical protein
MLAGVVNRAQIQVHPVLYLLDIGHRDEEQELTAVTRGDQTFRMSGLVRIIGIFDEVQNLRPKDRLCVRVRGVKGRVRDAGHHGYSLDRAREAVNRFPPCLVLLDLGQDRALVTDPTYFPGIEAHKRTHTVVAVDGNGTQLGTGMIKSAAGASYLVEHVNRRTNLGPCYDGIIDGAGLKKNDPRLLFRRVMFAMARRQAGQVMRRRDTREHVALYIKAFNAWPTDEELTQLRFTTRETMPPVVTKMR